MSKWRKVYWNDAKRFIAEYGVPIALVFIIGVMGTLAYARKALANEKNEYIQELEQYTKLLEDEQLELLETTTFMGEEIDRLVEENEVFGSMLAEIENEPGGHKLLKKLYDQER